MTLLTAFPQVPPEERHDGELRAALPGVRRLPLKHALFYPKVSTPHAHTVVTDDSYHVTIELYILHLHLHLHLHLSSRPSLRALQHSPKAARPLSLSLPPARACLIGRAALSRRRRTGCRAARSCGKGAARHGGLVQPLE